MNARCRNCQHALYIGVLALLEETTFTQIFGHRFGLPLNSLVPTIMRTFIFSILHLCACTSAFAAVPADQVALAPPEGGCQTEDYCPPGKPRCAIKEKELGCVDATAYPDWKGTEMSSSDCLAAWSGLKGRIATQDQQERLWTYWDERLQVPEPEAAFKHRAPMGEIVGKCLQVPGSHNLLTWDQALVTLPSPCSSRCHSDEVGMEYCQRRWCRMEQSALQSVDEATLPEIRDAVNRNVYCLKALGTPGGWYTGRNNSVGVFFWPSDSVVSKMFGRDELDERKTDL